MLSVETCFIKECVMEMHILAWYLMMKHGIQRIQGTNSDVCVCTI